MTVSHHRGLPYRREPGYARAVAKRNSLGGVIFRLVFMLPFIGAGALGLRTAIGHHQVSGAVMSALFAGVGVWQFVKALRELRSPEAELTKYKGSLALSDIRQPLAVDYRSAARGTQRAGEVYAPILETAPLPRIKKVPGKVFPARLSMTSPYEGIAFLVIAIVWSLGAFPGFVAALTTLHIGVIAFATPFALMGVGLLWMSIRKVSSRAKRPQIEVSEDPIFPGEELGVHFEQRGPMFITRLRAHLVCRERVTYGVGTSQSTEENDVFEEAILDEDAIAVARGEVCQRDFKAMIPRAGASSFASEHNQVQWLIRVRADISGWPDFDERYEFRVLPRPVA